LNYLCLTPHVRSLPVKATVSRTIALPVLWSATACGASPRPAPVPVPARLDLRPYGRLGLVTFTVENAKGSLHQFATDRFSEGILAAQPGTEVLELGSVDSLVKRVGEQDLGIAAAQELGKQRDIDAVFAGHLKVTNPQPGGGLAGLVSPHVDATVRLDLTVRLLSTRSGATLWRSSWRGSRRQRHRGRPRPARRARRARRRCSPGAASGA